MREYRLYLEDMAEAVKKIEKYSRGFNAQKLRKEDLVVDGIIRNLEIIGEAVKHIPRPIKNKYSKIEWKKIAGLRDILAHEYFGVDIDILWDIVANKIPDLKRNLALILQNHPK